MVQQLQQQLQMQGQQMQQMMKALQDQSFDKQMKLLKQGSDDALNEARAVKEETAAILNIAKAEAAEPGPNDVEGYRQVTQGIKADFEYDPAERRVKRASSAVG